MKNKLLLTLLAVSVVGCTSPDLFNDGRNDRVVSVKQEKDINLIKASHFAAEKLMNDASYLKVKLDPIVITSMANIVDVNSSSALGLTISEQMSDRFVQYGFPIVDIRARKDIKIHTETGEFMLSRDVRKISKQHAASAVLVGTYSEANNRVYVQTRLVRPSDNRVLAAYDFDLPLGPNTKSLLNTVTKQQDN